MERIFDESVMLDTGREEAIRKWEAAYLHFLRMVQFEQPGRRLLLKNPANTARIRLLKERFPGARFIHLHRNPYKVFASTVHLYLRAQTAWGLQATSRERVVAHILESYPKLMRAYFEQRTRLQEGELAEISFTSLQEKPMETLAFIYRKLGLDGFDQAAPHFRDYLESQRDYRKNRLELAEGEREAVAARWADIFERLGYEV